MHHETNLEFLKKILRACSTHKTTVHQSTILYKISSISQGIKNSGLIYPKNITTISNNTVYPKEPFKPA
jgi:hypothetical protein